MVGIDCPHTLALPSSPFDSFFFHSSDSTLPSRLPINTLLSSITLLLIQSRHPSQGTGQDLAQKSSFDRVGMAWHWRPAKPWMATLRHSSAGTSHSIVSSTSRYRPAKRTCRSRTSCQGSSGIPSPIPQVKKTHAYAME